MSLELLRIVNDALQTNDPEAAFAALSEFPNLRVSELPRLEKKSLTALSQALAEPAAAQIWADALLADVQSVRIFAAKTVLRLGDVLQPLALPLRDGLERFWKREMEFLARPQGHQDFGYHQGVELAIKVLFCADMSLALDVTKRQAEISTPLAQRQRNAYRVSVARQEAARTAFQDAMREIAQAETGQDWQSLVFTWSDEQRAAIRERARLVPAVAAAYEAIGPAVMLPQHIRYPYQNCARALGSLFSDKGEPQRTVSARLREPLLEIVETSLHASGAALAALGESLFDLQIFDEASCERLIPALALVREDAAATQALRATDEANVQPSEPRLTLWIKIIRHLMGGYYGRCSLERARQIYPLIQLGSAYSHYFDACLRSLRRRYGAALTDATAEVSPSSVDAAPAPDPLEAAGIFPTATRRVGEDALAFWRRATEEYLSNMERAHGIAYRQYVAHAYLEDGTPIHYHTAAALNAALWERYAASAQSFNDEEKREIVLYHVQEGSGHGEAARSWTVDNFRHYVSGGSTGKFEELLAPLTTQLWENYDQALHSVIHEEKALRTQQRSWSDALRDAYWRFRNVVKLLSALEGCDADLAMIKRALKARSKKLAHELEEGVMARKLDVFPTSSGSEVAAWQLGERYDALLERLATRVPQWPPYARLDGYSRLATGFYRRATPEARQRCLHFVTLAGQVRMVLFQCLEANDDQQTWAALLCVTQQRDHGFITLWKKWRSAPNTRDLALRTLLGALPQSATEQSAILMMKMLDDLTPQERADHAATWAENIEHPHPKLAKWALEALLKNPYSGLDWERAIETAGEKLWSENLGLTKVAARFLGAVPAEYAPLAWDKLSEALELENTDLVEAILKAMVTLVAKDKTLRLAEAAQDRLTNVAQLAPERFGPLQRRLGAVERNFSA